MRRFRRAADCHILILQPTLYHLQCAGNLTDFASPQRHILALKWANTFGSMVYMRVAWLSVRPAAHVPLLCMRPTLHGQTAQC